MKLHVSSMDAEKSCCVMRRHRILIHIYWRGQSCLVVLRNDASVLAVKFFKKPASNSAIRIVPREQSEIAAPLLIPTEQILPRARGLQGLQFAPMSKLSLPE